MRIIAGIHRGRKLYTVKGWNTRPTADRVKEALFNILQNEVYNSIFLDLFAGTGSIGVEALSRGAKQVFFVEQEKQAWQVIEKNLVNIDFSEKAVLLKMDIDLALKQLKGKKEKFDLIFLDPPYHANWEEMTLDSIVQGDLLAKTGTIIVEHLRKKHLPERIGNVYLQRNAFYGDTALSFYMREEEN